VPRPSPLKDEARCARIWAKLDQINTEIRESHDRIKMKGWRNRPEIKNPESINKVYLPRARPLLPQREDLKESETNE
jgi:hypothetical protein